MLLSALGTSIANVALPTLAQAFAASFQEVQWVVLAYLLAITTLIVSVGRLGDLTGRRRLLLAGIDRLTWPDDRDHTMVAPLTSNQTKEQCLGSTPPRSLWTHLGLWEFVGQGRRALDLMRPDNEWWARQLRDALPSASEWVVVPARHGSWLRNFVPSLGPRLIAVRGEEVVVFSQNIARTRVRREVWRGLRSDLDARPYFLNYLLRIRDHGSTLRLQVDGSFDVDRILRALDGVP